MPRGKHIRTVAHGLWGQPTNLNNVESYANVPWIVNHGAEAFAAMGTATSKGTKIFSLTGKVVNGGLIEVPMGATLREVIFDIGGGMLPGREFKAVQLGGPSGGCLPASLLDEPIDFESLVAAGSMMGSGGMVVVDDTTCMVDFAKFFLKFTAEESCGKCVPCRVGTSACSRSSSASAPARPPSTTWSGSSSSPTTSSRARSAQLGGSAPNPVLSTLRYFRDEVMAHVVERRCPAKVCRPLIRYTIDADACTGCHVCFGACPTAAISGERKQLHTIDQKLCIQCDTCRQVCKFDAVPVETGIFATGRREAAVSPRTKAAVKLTIDGKNLQAPRGRDRPRRSRAARASTSRRCATKRAWPPGAPAACAWSRSKASTSCRRPAPPGSPTAWSSRPTRRACAPAARATSRCTSRTTTPTARRPARTPAPRTSTSPPTWRRWPTATPPARPPSCARSCPSPASSGACARGTASPSAGAATWTTPSPSAPCTGRPPTTARRVLVPGVPSGRRVAVIGAGPAGLAAAWFLTEKGHQVTIYDANEKAGGSLRYSIPEFRLPEKVVDKELAPLWEAGVRFVGESELGYEVDPDGLFDAGFDAVVIGVGTWEEPKHLLPGDDAALRGLDDPQARARGPRREVHARRSP